MGVRLTGEYAASSQEWVRDEVEHLERTGRGLRDRPVVLLTTIGARTGLLRKTPLMRVEHAGTYAAVASAAGAQRHPHWYLNALAHPRIELWDAGALHVLQAREVEGAERGRWWSRACTVFPSYADYQGRTRRLIPVLLLELVDDAGGHASGPLLFDVAELPHRQRQQPREKEQRHDRVAGVVERDAGDVGEDPGRDVGLVAQS